MNEVLCYAPELNNNSSEIILSEEESFHVSKVLRFKIGDHLFVTNGNGVFSHAQISEIVKQNVKIVIKSIDYQEQTIYQSHAAICLLKSRETIEWTVEKLTELGINEISLVLSKRVERNVVNIERLKKIAISAMKQSFRFYLPVINPILPFSDFVLSQKTDERLKLIAWCGAGNIYNVSHIVLKKSSIVYLIGPEGDFTDEEVQFATGNGFAPVSLGSVRLRSETAAIHTLSAIITLNSL